MPTGSDNCLQVQAFYVFSLRFVIFVHICDMHILVYICIMQSLESGSGVVVFSVD